MTVEVKEAMALLIPDDSAKTSILESFISVYPEVKNHHIILDFSTIDPDSAQLIVKFQEISEKHRGEEKSFVIIANSDPDSLPETLIVVPTYQEAIDMIEMESIERDLRL